MQYFKGDELELKFYEAARPTFANRSLNKTTMFNECYECFILGDTIISENFAPLSNQIDSEVFRATFPEVFDAFIEGGTFEAYLKVFVALFGEDVDVTFTIPAAGKLQIAIIATGVELFEFLARTIVEDEYVFDNIIDYEDDLIMFQTLKGFISQYELERLLFEMVPSGVYTTISLSLGEE